MESVDVLLIHPPGPLSLISTSLPPLGIAYLASSLEEKGIDVKILDLNVHLISNKKTKKIITNLNPKVIGISATSAAIPQAVELAMIIKSTLNIPIVIGGPHANCDHTFIYRFKNLFDYQVVGEGEYTFPFL
jgi:radical SAM superfamily enzyme YgiQ (UPF0313 family)